MDWQSYLGKHVLIFYGQYIMGGEVKKVTATHIHLLEARSRQVMQIPLNEITKVEVN